MPRILPLLLTLLWGAARAQSNSYLADLATLKSLLQKTPSFKAQVTGNQLIAYDSLYQRLAQDTVRDPLSFRYFANLAQLIYPIRDNHLGFMQTNDYRHFRSQASLDSFVTSKAFLAYPTYPINLDSLKAQLAQSPLDSLEGIYHYGNHYAVGVFRSGLSQYTGVVVETASKLWRKGQIALHLHEFAPGRYRAIYGHPQFKILMYQPVERLVNRSLVYSSFYGSYFEGVYRKQLSSANYVHLVKGTPHFELKHLTSQIQYLLLRSFQTSPATAQRSRLFYDSIQHALTAPYLIVDLRDNQGGAEREARKYLTLLKKYVKKGHVYLLLNQDTISQAELFVLQLADGNHVTRIGQPTKGMLSYGSNYSTWQMLPGGSTRVYLTDMENGPKLLAYEDYGIRPDILLTSEANWLDQVVQTIEAQK